MSRLLHAAARGARIQYRSLIDRNWEESAFGSWQSLHDCKTADSSYRIHPEDAHLQYGPISTALREMTFDATLCKFSWEWTLASSATCEFASGIDAATLATDYDLYYLFLAEFLADEGM
jgi:hypothetical protein